MASRDYDGTETELDDLRPRNATAAPGPSRNRPDLAALDTSLPHLSRSQQQRGTTGDAGVAATDAIFAQLQLIQQLQTEITADHTALEKLNSMPDSSSDQDLDASASRQPTATDFGASSTTSRVKESPLKRKEDKTFGSSANNAGDGKGSGPDSYEQLAAAFKERQKGVDSIMDKLSQLSKAVKEFHSLPPPVLFPDEQPHTTSVHTGQTAEEGRAGRDRILRHMDIVETPVAMSPRQRFP